MCIEVGNNVSKGQWLHFYNKNKNKAKLIVRATFFNKINLLRNTWSICSWDWLQHASCDPEGIKQSRTKEITDVSEATVGFGGHHFYIFAEINTTNLVYFQPKQSNKKCHSINHNAANIKGFPKMITWSRTDCNCHAMST